MTKDEYCNVSDLQTLRIISFALNEVNAIEQPNKNRLKKIKKDLSLMKKHLEENINNKKLRECTKFNIDTSKWNLSKVKSLEDMYPDLVHKYRMSAKGKERMSAKGKERMLANGWKITDGGDYRKTKNYNFLISNNRVKAVYKEKEYLSKPNPMVKDEITIDFITVKEVIL